jgi:hypothetical protein
MDNDYSKQRREEPSNDQSLDNPNDEDYVPLSKEHSSTVSLITSKVCTFGLKDCAPNEMCHLTNHRHRQGVCVCKHGFARDENENCQPEIESSLQLPKADNDSGNTAEESQAVDLSSNAGSVVVDNSLLYRNISSTPFSATHLIVSAGPNQVL